MFQMDELLMGGITATVCRIGGTIRTDICYSSTYTYTLG